MEDARVPEGALRRWAPGLAELTRYRRAWLRPDVLAGVTVAAYLVPQVMAYAEIAGVPPVAGLWAISGALLVYVFLGSSRRLSVGPESTTALLTATAVAPLALGDPRRHAALAGALALIVAVICVAARLLRLGFLADLLSRPVLVGYMAGVAVIMVVGQLRAVTGVPVEGDGTPAQLGSFLSRIGEAEPATVLLSAAVLSFVLVGSRLFPRAPVLLVAVLLATAAVSLLDLREAGIQVVPQVPRGLPVPGVPDIGLHDLLTLLFPALGVAVVGYTDTVLTGRAFAAGPDDEPDANTELLALGAANASAGLLGGFPVSSSGSRTALNVSLGARTQLCSLVSLAVVLAALLFAGPVLSAFPRAALGALVVFAALRLVEISEFRRIAAFRRSELALALATTAGVLLADILYGVLIAIALSVLDLLRRVARPHDAVLGYVPGVAGMHDVADFPLARQVPGLVVYRYDSPLFFANAQDFRRRALAALAQAEGVPEWFVLNAEAVVEIDVTSVDALEQLRLELERRGVVLALARVKQDLREELSAAGILERLGPDRVFFTLPTAVAAYVAWYRDRHGRPPPVAFEVPLPPEDMGR